MKHADLRNMFRKTSKSVWKSTVVVPPDPLFLTPSASSAVKIPENTEEERRNPNGVL